MHGAEPKLINDGIDIPNPSNFLIWPQDMLMQSPNVNGPWSVVSGIFSPLAVQPAFYCNNSFETKPHFFYADFSACALHAQIISPKTNLNAREEQIIAASKLDANGTPEFNGAKIIGLRPNTPLIFSLAVGGERPLEFSASNLPPD